MEITERRYQTSMPISPIPEVKSLREYIYDFLRHEMNSGKIKPGSFLNLNELSRDLGMSKTPLRDALLHLEAEGFVTFFPRKGVMVNLLSLEKIRDIYEIIGALEAQTIHSIGGLITPKDIDHMDQLNQEMQQALEKDDFPLFYEKNLAFHDVYLKLSSNQELVHTVQILKQRLYDFPRIKGFVKEWEIRSTGEHEDIIHRLRQGDLWTAADYIRDVHWSFKVQERFIRKYYFLHQEENFPERTGQKKQL